MKLRERKMNMIDFRNYTAEINTVREYRNAKEAEAGRNIRYTTSDAFDMFRADIRAGQARDYNTGGALPGFDFAGLKVQWDAMTEAQQFQAISDYIDSRK